MSARRRPRRPAWAVSELAALHPLEHGGEDSGWNGSAQPAGPELARAAFGHARAVAKQGQLADRQLLGLGAGAGQGPGGAIAERRQAEIFGEAGIKL